MTLALLVTATWGRKRGFALCQPHIAFQTTTLPCRHLAGFRSRLLKMRENAIRLAMAADGLMLWLFLIVRGIILAFGVRPFSHAAFLK